MSHEIKGTPDNLPPDSIRLVDKQDVARMLGYTTRTIDRLIASRKIPYIRLPSAVGPRTKIKFDLRDIEKWLAKARQGGDQIK